MRLLGRLGGSRSVGRLLRSAGTGSEFLHLGHVDRLALNELLDVAPCEVAVEVTAVHLGEFLPREEVVHDFGGGSTEEVGFGGGDISAVGAQMSNQDFAEMEEDAHERTSSTASVPASWARTVAMARAAVKTKVTASLTILRDCYERVSSVDGKGEWIEIEESLKHSKRSTCGDGMRPAQLRGTRSCQQSPLIYVAGVEAVLSAAMRTSCQRACDGDGLISRTTLACHCGRLGIWTA